MQRMARYGRRHKVERTAVGAGLALVFGCLLGVLGEARAQAVYKWTDERGVVHFSDTAPPKGEYRLMQLPPPEVREEPPDAPVEEANAAPPAAEAKPEPKRSGPASLKITEQKEEPVGESTHQYRGKVKNVGGTTASEVVVSIKVTDSNQGAECVNEQIEVRPSQLAAGETGTYAVEFTNPCYFGPTSASLQPEWE
jgi:hypothetical protein